MAQKFKLISVLWLIVACLADTKVAEGSTTIAAAPAKNITTTAPTTTTTTAPATTATTPTTTTAAPVTTATATAPTTTTKAPATTATTPTTTAAAPVTTATATAPTTTTKAPATTATTPTTTTTAPVTTATATAPTTTTKAPATTATTPTATTAAPVTTATATATTPTITTADPDGSSTTLTPATTPAPTTTKLPDPCDGNPCGDGSTCVPRFNQSFACLCLVGENYNNDSRRCESAKVFPGQLALPELTYKAKMSDDTSQEFQSASKNIIDALFDVFKNIAGYSGSTVLALRPNKASKVKARSRSETGVRADVEIIFTEQAEITTGEVIEKMNKASSGDGVLKGAVFKETDLCEKKPCDEGSTKCNRGNGSFTCTCLDNYIKTDYTTKMCIACPSGQKAEGSKKCVNCPFGYSGFNCNESWKLVLVIVGSVLGGLLLIALILLPIVARKSSKKSSKMNKNADIGKPYMSHPPANKPLVNSSLANSQQTSVNRQANGLSAFANAGVPRIPRASTTNSWDSRTNLEMTPNTSRQNLIPEGRNSRYYDDHDDNQYAQARPQTNPYAQNRPEVNPYAQNQGHRNPYYTHDDGRRLN